MSFSFSMDDLTDNGYYNGLNTGWSPIQSSRIKKQVQKNVAPEKDRIYRKVKIYSTAKECRDIVEVKKTQSDIENELDELETSIGYYRIAERNLLKVKNFGNIQSIIICDIIDNLLVFYDDSCDAIADIINDMKKKYDFAYSAKSKEVDEKKVNSDVIKNIFNVVARAIASDLPLSHYLFKHLVKDLEQVLEILGESGTKIKKLDVEKYFLENCKMHEGMVICQNCNRRMLAEIPYCFICFDGRYS